MNNKMDYYKCVLKPDISSSKSCKNIYDLHNVEQFPSSRRDHVKKGQKESFFVPGNCFLKINLSKR